MANQTNCIQHKTIYAKLSKLYPAQNNICQVKQIVPSTKQYMANQTNCIQHKTIYAKLSKVCPTLNNLCQIKQSMSSTKQYVS